MARAEGDIAALRTIPKGQIIIGMPPSVGSVLTVPLVRSFRRDFPLIAMRVMEGFSGHVLEWLMTGKIDVAVLYNAPGVSNLISEPLLQDELFLLGADTDPERLPPGPVLASRLSALPMIMPSRPHGLRLLVDQILGAAHIKVNVELEVEAMPSTLNLVEQGFGYTVLSYSSCHQLVRSGRIKLWRIVEPQLTRQLLLATSTQRPTTTATRALADMVRSQVRELLTRGAWIPPQAVLSHPACAS